MLQFSVPRSNLIRRWVFTASGLVAGIIAVGGITRLTNSGLSMVDWSLMHFKPPVSDEEWELYFDKYKRRNKDMTTDEFKRIYYLEHFHRVYGRLLGLFIILPTTYLVASKGLKIRHKLSLATASLLVCAQGFLGWYMVKSGLTDSMDKDPKVSPLRLTMHLGCALSIYTLLLNTGLRMSAPKPEQCVLNRRAVTLQLCSFLVILTALSGALVAGNRAGKVYDSFPKMGSKWIPDDYHSGTSFFGNMTRNPSAVQFHHRIIAVSTGSILLGVSICNMYSLHIPLSVKRNYMVIAALTTSQIALGIATLLSHVPTGLASMHQMGSVALLTSTMYTAHRVKSMMRQRV